MFVINCNNQCLKCEQGVDDDAVLFCEHRAKMIRRGSSCTMSTTATEHWRPAKLCAQFTDCVGCPHEVEIIRPQTGKVDKCTTCGGHTGNNTLNQCNGCQDLITGV